MEKEYLNFLYVLPCFSSNKPLIEEKLNLETKNISCFLKNEEESQLEIEKQLFNYLEIYPITTNTDFSKFEFLLRFFSEMVFVSLNSNKKLNEILSFYPNFIKKNIVTIVIDSIERITLRSIDYLNNKNDNINLEKNIFKDFIVNHPLLFDTIKKNIEYYIDYFLLLLNRLKTDSDLIRDQFDIHFNDISNVDLCGDKHENGNTVAIIVFKNSKKIVYKPRNLSIDVLFHKIINIFNSKSKLQLKYPLTMNRHNEYGWVEFIEYQPCLTLYKIENFYHRIGLIQSLLYYLNGHDIHYDNLIASDEFPIIIDSECFFNTHFEKDKINNPLFNSVLNSLLLPSKLTCGGDTIWLGGVNDIKNQLALLDSEFLSSEMIYKKEKLRYKSSQNIPFQYENENTFLNYIVNIKKGFEEGYNIIIKSKQLFKEIVFQSETIIIRHLPRPTYTYTYLRHESYNPSILEKTIDRNIFFDWLWYKSSPNIVFNKLIKYEKNALINDCIPHFCYIINSKGICTNNGIEIIKKYFFKSGQALFEKKIFSMSNTDRRNQLILIDKSIELYKGEVEKQIFKIESKINIKTIDKFNKLIFRIIKNKVKEQYFSNVNEFIDITETKDGNSITLMDIDFYDGLAGLLHYFIYYDQYYPSKSNKKTIYKLINIICNKIEKNNDYSIGAFKGLSGIVYVFCNYFKLSGNNFILDKINWLLKIIYEKINDKCSYEDLNFDIINGLSGCIIAVKSAIDMNRTLSINIINKCAQILIEKSNISQSGYFWKNFNKTTTLGFAHGNSGVAYAFAIAFKITKNNNYKNFLYSAIVNENKFFNKICNNWENFNKDEKEKFSYYWCNGSAGIGLSRIYCSEILNSNEFDSDILSSINSVLLHGFGNNECLCHGNFGNIELIYKHLCKTQSAEKAQIFINKSLKKIIKNIFLNGLKFSSHHTLITLSLMTGITGLGFQLLRFKHVEKIPSIMTLD